MAIYHFTAKIISRGKGQSAIAAAAYRSGERLRDEQASETKDYTARAERIVYADILAPKDAPEWAHDRNTLWNEAERAEKRKDAQLAREIEMSLPHELTGQQREWLVNDFAREAFVRKGYAVDIAIHAPDKHSDERNHHAHMLVTRRTLGPHGFAATKDWKFDKKQLGQWREAWAHLANRHLERHGQSERIDHRSLSDQGLDREPGVHVGYAGNEMAARGAQSDRWDENQAVQARNETRAALRAIEAELVPYEQIGVRHDRKARRAEPGLRVIDAATGAAARLTDTVNDLLARKQQWRARITERDAQALQRIAEDIKAGKPLSRADVANLTREHQEQIRHFGDAAMRQMVEDARKRAEEYWKDRGRERERD